MPPCVHMVMYAGVDGANLIWGLIDMNLLNFSKYPFILQSDYTTWN